MVDDRIERYYAGLVARTGAMTDHSRMIADLISRSSAEELKENSGVITGVITGLAIALDTITDQQSALGLKYNDIPPLTPASAERLKDEINNMLKNGKISAEQLEGLMKNTQDYLSGKNNDVRPARGDSAKGDTTNDRGGLKFY